MEVETGEESLNTVYEKLESEGTKIISEDEKTGESYKFVLNERYETVRFKTLEDLLPAHIFQSLEGLSESKVITTESEKKVREAFHNGGHISSDIAEIIEYITSKGEEEVKEDIENLKRKKVTPSLRFNN